jgi:hypothetical protein
MAARSEVEVNSLLVYKSLAWKGGVLYYPTARGLTDRLIALALPSNRPTPGWCRINPQTFLGLSFNSSSTTGAKGDYINPIAVCARHQHDCGKACQEPRHGFLIPFHQF